MSANTFGSRRPLLVGGGRHTIHALDALDAIADVSRLPFSLKILLENLLRHEDGVSGDRRRHRARSPTGTPAAEPAHARSPSPRPAS